jgi:hypothetical protein
MLYMDRSVIWTVKTIMSEWESTLLLVGKHNSLYVMAKCMTCFDSTVRQGANQMEAHPYNGSSLTSQSKAKD